MTYTRALMWSGKGEEVLLLTLMMERAARRLQSHEVQLNTLSAIAMVLLLVGMPGLAARCLDSARRLLPHCSMAIQNNYLGASSLFEYMNAQWPELWATMEKVRTESRRQGDLGTECHALFIIILQPLMAGRLAELAPGIAELRQLAQRSENAQHLGTADFLESILALHRDENARALEYAQTAWTAAHKTRDTAGESRAQGLLGLAQLRLGDWSQAVKTAAQLLARLEEDLLNNTVYVDSAAAPAEIFVTVWQKGWAVGPQVQKDAQRAVTRLGRSVRVNKMNRPRWLLWAGLLCEQQGRDQRHRARALLQDSCESARRLQLPLEEGRARLELGRILGADDAAGRAQLLRALTIFNEATAFHYVKKAEALLGQVVTSSP